MTITSSATTVRVGTYDPKLGRLRTHTDDFYDHRKMVQEKITWALEQEKKDKRR